MTKTKSGRFTHCVVLANPLSTSRHRGKRFINQLRPLFEDNFTLLETASRDYQNPNRLASKLRSVLRPGCLLGIAGGDGTISLVVNLLLQDRALSKIVTKVTILPLWGGNANDLANMVNGPAKRADLKQIFSNGKIVPIHPLEVTLQNKHKEVKLATNYVSFGASAYAAKQINQMSKPKNLRLAREIWQTVKAAYRAKQFKAEIDGKIISLYDVILINGSRIAKVYRAPNSLTDKAFFELTVNRKHPFILFYFASILTKLTVRRKTATLYSFKIIDPAWIQIDGEVAEISKDTQITIRPCKQALYLLSTKL